MAGIMPPDFQYPIGASRPTDLWVPFVVPERERIRNPNYHSFYLQSIARLKPGVSLEQAQAQMDQIAAALEKTHPVWNKDRRAGVRLLRDHLVGASTKSWMLMLLGAVAIVLLIACANVANLLLARASSREREVGIRAALGAGRWRLVRQLMVESLVLSIAGTVLATLVAYWAVQVLRGAMPEGVPRVASIAVDLRVLLAAAGLSLVTGLLFGILPALQLSKPDLAHALKDGGRGSVGAGRQRLRSILVVAEVALAVVLLVGAALFIGSFVALMRIQPGFDPANVLTAQVTIPRTAPGSKPPDSTLAFQQILERISQASGVVHASAISGGMPLGGSMWTTDMKVAGRKTDDQGISIRTVSPDYHKALRIPLRSGRLFEAADRQGTTKVAIVNESAAKKYFPGENPIGQTAEIDESPRTIVGIVGDVRQSSLETEPTAEVYVPLSAVSGIVGRARHQDGRRSVCGAAGDQGGSAGGVARRPAPQRADDGGADGPPRRAAATQHAAARAVRAVGSRHLGRWHLRRDGLHRGAAHARDWCAHGARRDTQRTWSAWSCGNAAVMVAGGPGDRRCRRLVSQRGRQDVSVPARDERPARVRRRRIVAGAGGTHRQRHARTPRG